MNVRAKFECCSVMEQKSYESDVVINVHVTLHAVTNEESVENKMFWENTPSGQLEMDITNPGAYNQFKEGKQYYIDFTEI